MLLLNNIKRHTRRITAGLFASACSFSSYASSTGMPWEDPLTRIVDSITGPVAFGASVLGIVVAGGSLLFGGDLDGFVQKIMILALVVAVVVGATNLLGTLFGVSGALIL
ncbi:TrbC/VirB2 family protein [uncultured Vibrio sp.]|uniref:TrbC/VirB2 family protein n=1 Tax=uncultured Vibrio sp. TaxID=114054 RepID=UPI0026200D11|nr:TrbC/VirB2 family protein [uncultured Vibrio sp.]